MRSLASHSRPILFSILKRTFCQLKLLDFKLSIQIPRPTSFKIHENRGIFRWIRHSHEPFRSQTLRLIPDFGGFCFLINQLN
ncbi:hypothetical protein MRB53_018453 [Persea americana]|uniref:Uncharacterized protein n=1 Tax=Persea americana TaxID=3435 RepID=A0ACC2M8V8_PERAE|nr:hypothetical protein MRB53_018453 [Persea americana]